MQANELWAQFAQANNLTNESYDAWVFGGAPDELARLVLQGEKMATSSAYDIYQVKNQPLPQAGEYSVILNSKREAVCIIRTTKVQILPFDKVDEQHARKEGEGDKSLNYWRKSTGIFSRQLYKKSVYLLMKAEKLSAKSLKSSTRKIEKAHPRWVRFIFVFYRTSDARHKLYYLAKAYSRLGSGNLPPGASFLDLTIFLKKMDKNFNICITSFRRGRLIAIFIKVKRGYRATRDSPAGVPRRLSRHTSRPDLVRRPRPAFRATDTHCRRSGCTSNPGKAYVPPM